MPLGDFRKEQWLAYGVTGVNNAIKSAIEHGAELDPELASFAKQKISPYLERGKDLCMMNMPIVNSSII